MGTIQRRLEKDWQKKYYKAMDEVGGRELGELTE